MVGPLEDCREELTRLCRDFRVKRLDAFGSAAGQERFDPARSDIDLLEIRAETNPYLLESIEKQRRQIYAA